uniref:Putative secreted peptide n=1 Tax=Anopheles braziliensis TaxID=58242 RepID=A0A2M3ZXN6_9DIPT
MRLVCWLIIIVRSSDLTGVNGQIRGKHVNWAQECFVVESANRGLIGSPGVRLLCYGGGSGNYKKNPQTNHY